MDRYSVDQTNNSFTTFIADQFATLATAANGMQFGVLLLAVLVAWIVHRSAFTRLRAQSGEQRRSGWRKLIIHGGQRLVLPITALALVLAARGLFRHLHWDVNVLDIVVPLLASLAAIRISIYVLRKSFGPGRALKAWENFIGTTVWILLALHLLGWLPEFLSWMDEIGFNAGPNRISLLVICKLIIAVAVFLVIAQWIARIIENRLMRAQRLDAGMRIGLAKFSKFFLLSLAVLIALNSVGIDLTALTVFGGALGVGLGFGLQRIASNLVSGFILVFERSIRQGDVISIGDSYGEVVALHARYIVVRSRDGVETLIPNETLITSQVINWTYSDRRVRVKVPVQVSYNDDPERCMLLMIEAARAQSRVIQNPGPEALLTSFGDNGINLELQVWIDDPEHGVANLRSDLLVAIWHAFNAQNISIPFPQRDIHVKSMPPREPA